MGVPVATITDQQGQKLGSAFDLLSLEVRRELNRIPEAVLKLLDGSVAKRVFELSDQSFFEPGKRVSIALRYEGEGADTVIFDGLVVRHEVESDIGGSTLRIELKDRAFKLTRQRKSLVFRQQTDDEAIRKLLSEAGLDIGEIASKTTKYEELVQYYATDWDFLVSRADVEGMVVKVERGQVSVSPMLPAGAEAKARLDFGISEGLEFELRLDGADQWAEVSSSAWDPSKLETSQPSDARQPEVTVGNLDASAIAKALGGESCSLVHPGIPSDGELSAWADSRLLRSRLALLQGKLSMPGRVDIAPLDLVELAGIGARFNGKALVSAVVDRLDQAGWRTELTLGLSAEWFARTPEIAEVPAGGMLPAVHGLQIGVVADFESDAQGEHRVKVLLSGMASAQGPVWARVARPDAGNERGMAYWPEPGDEVAVGFVYGDPRQAIIIGALYGSKNAPPAVVGAPSQENEQRALVSKSGLFIAFDDKKKAVRIETPGKNKLVIDDDGKAISLSDQHGNELVLDENGITLKSYKDFTIDASSGKVSIKASSVEVQ